MGTADAASVHLWVASACTAAAVFNVVLYLLNRRET